jgi:hypothetical protein
LPPPVDSQGGQTHGVIAGFVQVLHGLPGLIAQLAAGLALEQSSRRSSTCTFLICWREFAGNAELPGQAA